MVVKPPCTRVTVQVTPPPEAEKVNGGIGLAGTLVHVVDAEVPEPELLELEQVTAEPSPRKLTLPLKVLVQLTPTAPLRPDELVNVVLFDPIAETE